MKRTFTQMLSLVLVALAFQTATAQDQIFEVNSPPDLADVFYEFGQAGAPDWGGALGVGESLTGDLAYVQADTTAGDLAGDLPGEGCVMLNNADDIAGKIAVVDRGSCFFSDKVWYAQEAGAIAVVICNNQPGAGVINMGTGGDFAGLDTIPTGMINFEVCGALKDALADGETISATFSVQEFLGLTTAYTYMTPQANIVPLEQIGVQLYNATPDTVEATITWDIEEPSGNVTTLTLETGVAQDPVIFISDESYTPSEIGTYVVTASNSLNEFVLVDSFEITQSTFAIDRGEVTGDVGPSNELFATDYNFTYDYGYVMRTGDNPLDLMTLEFGLGNWSEIQSNGPVDFSIVVYNADPDGDGLPPNADNPLNSYDDLGDPITFTIYSSTGNEVDGETVFAEFLPTTLEAGGMYYVVVQYNGVAADNGVAPQYLIGGNVEYIGFNTLLFLNNGQFFSGWSGGARPILRVNPIILSIENELPVTALEVSPNPVSTELNLNLDLDAVSGKVQFQIVDMAARLVLNQTVENVQSGTFSFDTSNYTAGTYLLRVVTDEGASISKFIKQ